MAAGRRSRCRESSLGQERREETHSVRTAGRKAAATGSSARAREGSRGSAIRQEDSLRERGSRKTVSRKKHSGRKRSGEKAGADRTERGVSIRITATGRARRIIGTRAETDTIQEEVRRNRKNPMEVRLREKERLDELQRNGYRIIQNPEKFCFGMDAVLLTGFAHAKTTDRLLDLGTGTGIIPLLMEAKYHCACLTGLEIQAESADMAARSVKLNGLEHKIEIIVGDIKEADRIFPSASFDCITCNPPYMIVQHGIANPDAPKAIARHEILCTFQDVVSQTAKLLKPGGRFFLVHRPFRLAEILVSLSRHGLEPKRMQMVHPYVDREPAMVLLEAVRGGRPRMQVEKPLIIYREQGVYSAEFREIYGF